MRGIASDEGGEAKGGCDSLRVRRNDFPPLMFTTVSCVHASHCTENMQIAIFQAFLALLLCFLNINMDRSVLAKRSSPAARRRVARESDDIRSMLPASPIQLGAGPLLTKTTGCLISPPTLCGVCGFRSEPRSYRDYLFRLSTTKKGVIRSLLFRTWNCLGHTQTPKIQIDTRVTLASQDPFDDDKKTRHLSDFTLDDEDTLDYLIKP